MEVGELKQMIVGMIDSDYLASTCQSIGQYRSLIMRKIMHIDIEYQFETKEDGKEAKDE